MSDALMIKAADYREKFGLKERTLKRYLAEGKIPTATKDSAGHWWVSASEPAPILGQVRRVAPDPETQAVAVARRALEAQPTVQAVLDRETGFVSLETASRLLGVSERTIRHHKEEFGAVPYGPRGTLVVPQAAIRRVIG